ncbi:hypothetical protein Sjap_024658 [Stephania japonica]|uniref:Uncharacterized protein n=1 Tax=Stephania japonica TaxID=461633 RepID=A0AAP0EDS4_9MAGN
MTSFQKHHKNKHNQRRTTKTLRVAVALENRFVVAEVVRGSAGGGVGASGFVFPVDVEEEEEGEVGGGV